MRMVLGAGFMIFGLFVVVPEGWAGKFGGFSADGQRFLNGTDRMCAPLDLDQTGPASCEIIGDRKSLKTYGFYRRMAPARFAARIKDRLVSINEGMRLVRTWEARSQVATVLAIYQSSGQLGRDAVMAIEYQVEGGATESIAFRVTREAAYSPEGVW